MSTTIYIIESRMGSSDWEEVVSDTDPVALLREVINEKSEHSSSYYYRLREEGVEEQA